MIPKLSKWPWSRPMCTASDSGEQRPGNGMGAAPERNSTYYLGEVLFFLVSEANKVHFNAYHTQAGPAKINQMCKKNVTAGIAEYLPEDLHGNWAASAPGEHSSSDGHQSVPAHTHTRLPNRTPDISSAHWPQVLVQFYKMMCVLKSFLPYLL